MLGEVKSFVEADGVVNVLDSDSNSIVLSHRLKIRQTEIVFLGLWRG